MLFVQRFHLGFLNVTRMEDSVVSSVWSYEVTSFSATSTTTSEHCTYISRAYIERFSSSSCCIKLAFHDADTDTDTDVLVRIFADTSDTRDFLKLFPTRRHSRDDLREDIGVGVRVGIVECQL